MFFNEFLTPDCSHALCGERKLHESRFYHEGQECYIRQVWFSGVFESAEDFHDVLVSVIVHDRMVKCLQNGEADEYIQFSVCFENDDDRSDVMEFRDVCGFRAFIDGLEMGIDWE